MASPMLDIERSLMIKWSWVSGLLAIILGRTGYALVHMDYFIQNPITFFQLHHTGGIHGESALLGGLLGLGFCACSKQKPDTAGNHTPSSLSTHAFLQLLALYSPAILFVAASAWWACMQLGCAWGYAIGLSGTKFPWLLIQGPDLYHRLQPRYPVQLIGLLLALTSAGCSVIHPRRIFPGTSALIFYCLGTAALTLLRGDVVPSVGKIRMDTLQNIVVAFILSWMIYRSGRRLRFRFSI
jgi:prolipoprotein diacylglyceryltransferase